VPVAHINVGSVCVISPVSDTISYCETFQVRLEDFGVICVFLIVLVDVVGKIGDVDTSVGLTGDVEFVIFELGELFEPL